MVTQLRIDKTQDSNNYFSRIVPMSANYEQLRQEQTSKASKSGKDKKVKPVKVGGTTLTSLRAKKVALSTTLKSYQNTAVGVKETNFLTNRAVK